jgi:hypothetical protein
MHKQVRAWCEYGAAEPSLSTAVEEYCTQRPPLLRQPKGRRMPSLWTLPTFAPTCLGGHGMLLTDRRVAVSTADAKLPGLLQNTVFVILGGAHRPHLRMHASTPLNSITKTRAPARIHRLGLVCVGTSAAAPARSLLKLGATVASARPLPCGPPLPSTGAPLRALHAAPVCSGRA